ncbi:MAG: small ribosomal subunit Rsm22 family protein [Parachlamydiales bacterium]|jgi:ribosomal protein RSM22 (predicted rRNA methylase)
MNDLEHKLFYKIQEAISNISLKELQSIASSLSQKYHKNIFDFFSSDLQRLAYITYRMPATYNALVYVFKEMKKISPDIEVKTILDLGSGPATSAWAAFSEFKKLKQMHLVERDVNILNIGKKLLDNEPFAKKIEYEENNILKIKNYDYDLVVLSYVANELKEPFVKKIIQRWIYSNSKTILILEPGTPYGFKKIKYIRQMLIDNNCKIIAPCPNELRCPMTQEDWCHFFVRLKRSKSHKYLKKGTLGFEDEKFSYVIATKNAVAKPNSRNVRNPKSDSSEVVLTLCHNGKIVKETIEKKDKKFKIARKTKWGDSFDV